MQIWIINLFTELPGEGSREGRFLSLSKVLAQYGHEITWWTTNFNHRLKAVRTEETIHEAEEILRKESLAASVRIRTISVPRYSKNISLRRIYSHWRFGARFLRVALKVPKAKRPSRIVASSPPLEAANAALFLGDRWNCPVVIDLTDLWPHTFERIFPGGAKLRRFFGSITFLRFHNLAKRLYKRAALVSAVSQEYLDEVKKWAPKQNTHLCYIGGELLCPSISSSSGTLGSTPRRFIYIGAMTHSYDLETVIAAGENLISAGHSFEIHFAGSGADESRLCALANRSTKNQNFIFHGFLEKLQLDSLLAEMDVGLNLIRPNLAITMPHKLSDYICAGLPVINSLKGEADDLLSRAGCGVFYNAGDPGSLERALAFYLEPAELAAAQKRALQMASRQFERAKTYQSWAQSILKA